MADQVNASTEIGVTGHLYQVFKRGHVEQIYNVTVLLKIAVQNVFF